MLFTSEPLFFDREAEFTVSAGRLPHWGQAGTVCFITFRTWDSLPHEVVARFLAARDEWLRGHGIDANRPDWEPAVARLQPDERASFRRLCSTRWNDSLDASYGSCSLRNPTCAQIVADSLLHFDGDRYVVFDFVVMPNHVHVLASFAAPDVMRKQCESWKHYTAARLNPLLGRKNRFWEAESFDHLIRSERHFERLRDYIADNPRVANVRAGEFTHYSRELPASPKRAVSLPPLAERADHTKRGPQ